MRRGRCNRKSDKVREGCCLGPGENRHTPKKGFSRFPSNSRNKFTLKFPLRKKDFIVGEGVRERDLFCPSC